MNFIFSVSIIAIVNALLISWCMKQYLQYRLDSKFLEQEFYFRLYFPIQEAMICAECNCIFSKDDFMQCPVCTNDQNFYLNVAIDPLMQLEQQKKLDRILQ